VARLKALASGWRDPQSRDGMALVLSSAISSAVGMLYWVVAARMFDPATVGVNTTVVSTLGLLGIIAQLNLGSAMLRFVPVVGRGARALVAACYATGIGAALVIGTGFALGAGWWGTGPAGRGRGGRARGLLRRRDAVLDRVQHAGLPAHRIKRARIVPFENLGFALLKIVLLVVGGLLGFSGAIAGSWALGTAVTVVAISIYLFRVLPPHQAKGERPPSPVTLRAMRGFVAADWLGSMCLTIVNFGLPLLVFAELGADSAATFGVAWQLAYALYLVPTGMGQSLVAHSAADPSDVDAAYRTMLTKSLTLVIPAVLVLSAGSWLVLMVFGEHYAETGSLLLALSVFSAIPACVNLSEIAAARVRQHRLGQYGVTLASALITIPAVLGGHAAVGPPRCGCGAPRRPGHRRRRGAAAQARPPRRRFRRLTPGPPVQG
jgi:O-antigen/teichoic acid export membrane protein